ncbi:MAG: hypothetical protein AAF790_01200 [Planctomycetota bacterium]
MFEFDSRRRPLEDYEEPDEPEHDGPEYDGFDDGYGGDGYGEPGVDTVPCPACGADVYEDALRCAVCGDYITHGASPWAGRSPLWVALGLAGILAVIAALTL